MCVRNKKDKKRIVYRTHTQRKLMHTPILYRNQ